MKNLIDVYSHVQSLPGIHLFTCKDPFREQYGSIYLQYGTAIDHKLAKPEMIKFPEDDSEIKTMYAYATNAHVLAKLDLQNYFDVALMIKTFETEFELTDIKLAISPDSWKKLMKASYFKIVHFDENFYFQIYDHKLNMKETVIVNIQSSQFTSKSWIPNNIKYDDVFPQKSEEKSAEIIYNSATLNILSSAFNDKEMNLQFMIQDARKCTSVFVVKDSVCTAELLICPVNEVYSA